MKAEHQNKADLIKHDYTLLMSCQRSVDDLNQVMLLVLDEVILPFNYRFYLNSGSELKHGFFLSHNSDHVFDERADIDNIERFDISTLEHYATTGDFFPALLNERFYACVVTEHGIAREIDEQIVCVLAIYCNVLNLITDSKVDGLTGLLNRKCFDNDLLQELSTHDESGRRKSDESNTDLTNFLAIIDIDHFKQVNDQHGHLIGDEVLLTLAQTLNKNFRDHDGLYRYGGEEFAIILRKVSPQDAESILTRFCETVENGAFPTVQNITISIGFNKIEPKKSPSEIIESADKALYYSKENGRNQVSSYQQLELSGKVKTQIVDTDIELF